MAESSSSSSGGIGLLGFTFLIFLFLKLAEIGPVAAWSWWAVTAPLWLGFPALILFVLVIALIVAVFR